MSLQLQAATPGQLDEIAALLCAAFEAPPDVPFADRGLLQWKYFTAAEVWRQPCSFVLASDESLAAHCAVAPIALVVPRDNKRVFGVCFMDWVSGPRYPYAGVLLKKQLLAMNDVAIVTGGTPATRALIPKLGFTVYASVDTFARIVRPFKKWRHDRTANGWKDVARLARDTVWSLSPLGHVSPAWTAKPVQQFAEATETSVNLTMPEHGVDVLNYWLRCPSRRITGYEIHHRGRRCGHFLLSHARGETRIADLRITTADPAAWQTAYRLAARIASDDAATFQVIARASSRLAREALMACGFRWLDNTPLTIYDPKGTLNGAPPLCWSFIEDDACYL